MVYDSSSLLKSSIKKSKTNQFNDSKSFKNLYMAESHKYMVYVFQMLSFNIDNKGGNKPISLKKNYKMT